MKTRERARRGRAALFLGAALLALVGCGPRNKLGDQLLGQDSITNGRSSVTSTPPTKAP